MPNLKKAFLLNTLFILIPLFQAQGSQDGGASKATVSLFGGEHTVGSELSQIPPRGTSYHEYWYLIEKSTLKTPNLKWVSHGGGRYQGPGYYELTELTEEEAQKKRKKREAEEEKMLKHYRQVYGPFFPLLEIIKTHEELFDLYENPNSLNSPKNEKTGFNTYFDLKLIYPELVTHPSIRLFRQGFRRASDFYMSGGKRVYFDNDVKRFLSSLDKEEEDLCRDYFDSRIKVISRLGYLPPRAPADLSYLENESVYVKARESLTSDILNEERDLLYIAILSCEMDESISPKKPRGCPEHLFPRRHSTLHEEFLRALFMYEMKYKRLQRRIPEVKDYIKRFLLACLLTDKISPEDFKKIFQ